MHETLWSLDTLPNIDFLQTQDIRLWDQEFQNFATSHDAHTNDI